jgi:hypothetical protein
MSPIYCKYGHIDSVDWLAFRQSLPNARLGNSLPTFTHVDRNIQLSEHCVSRAEYERVAELLKPSNTQHSWRSA